MQLFRLFAIVVLIIAVQLPAIAQEVVRVRGGGHLGFGRIVFDWTSPVGYNANINGRTLTVRFERPLKANFSQTIKILRDYISSARISKDNSIVKISLKDDFDLKTFKIGTSIVLDVVRRQGVVPVSETNESIPLLRVRKGQHNKYARLVFDWTRPVEYEVSRDGIRVKVRFNRPARINIADLHANLNRGFSNPSTSIEGDKLMFSVDVTKGARIRHFRSGTKIVLDVFRGSQATTATNLPKKKQKIKTSPEAPVASVSPSQTDKPIRLLAKPDEKQAQETSKSKEQNKKQVVSTGKVRDTRPENKKQDGTPLKPDAATSMGKSSVKTDLKEAKSQKRKKADENRPEQDELPPDPVTLVFEWPQEVSMATFRRNKHVWIVFGSRSPIKTALLQQQSSTLLDRIDQIPSGQATILRIQTKDDSINVSKVQLDGTNWLIEFSRSPMQPMLPIPFGINITGSTGPELLMPLEATGRLLEFQDPDIGDTIQVVAITEPGLGINGERAYPEFQILASAQGVAIETFNDDLGLKKQEKEIVLSGPRGLYVSEIVSVPTKMDTADAVKSSVPFGVVGSQILQPIKWQRGSLDELTDTRQELMAEIAKQPSNQRSKSRMELARYNFSHGLAQEALGVLSLVGLSDLEVASSEDYSALKGAALVLAERGLAARKTLSDPRLDGFQDIALWRGAADDLTGAQKSAVNNFNTGDPSLFGYPISLKPKLLVRRLKVALDAEQIELAKEWRDQTLGEIEAYGPTYKARLENLFGRLYRMELDFDNAVASFQSAKDSGDHYSSVRAEYNLIDINLQQETIELEEAIQRYERLRYAWRGDAFERQVLNRLGELYLAEGDYRNALNTLKVIVAYFPKHSDAKNAAERMRGVFRRLYLEGEADNISPLKALALYDEFRELTPAGPDSNLIIQKLAERLIDVDLLDKASEVLGHQVKFRLRGEEKAAVGTKLALIRLIARDPEGALVALRDSFYPNVSLEIENDRRRIRAKAEFELGKANDAIALLAGDVSREADLLRSAIYFREKNWAEAAKVYQRLVGDPPADGASIDDEFGRTVLLWAVALKLHKDEDALRQLFELYGAAMRASPLSATFDYIAKPSEGAGFDAGSIQKQIADVDQFQAFMKNYRERLLKSKGKPKDQTGAKPAQSDPSTTG
ncbi:MAG: hypothetical protein CMP14_08010 [Rickettsiales bacterium]|nr:hypothetical protein [Rickettsiales bacterium]